MFFHYSKGFSKQQLINLKFPHTILQTRLQFNAEVVSFVPESRFGWTFYSPGMLNESTLWYGWILCSSQHSGLPQPPAEWGVMNSVRGRHREWGGVLKLGDRFCSFVPHGWACSKGAALFKQT